MVPLTQTKIYARITGMPRELVLFITASLALGIAFSMFDSTFNNFLNETYALTGFQRSFLEFPRELPGFLVVFTSALLSFLCSRRLGAVSMLFSVAGALLIAFAAPTYAWMVVWLFIWSTGQHLFMPVAATIGMELAREGQEGRRLGQLNAVRNMAAILGSFAVSIGFRFLGLTFQTVFVIAAVALFIAAMLLFAMKRQKTETPKTFLQLHKEYRLFYILAVLYGTRKQLFITFAPWVLVTVFQQETSLLATLFTIGGVIGIAFQPLLGWAIDNFGERMVLVAEAVLLIFVCFGYGFSKFLFSEQVAFLLVCACFLFDQMLMSVGMARSTYMKKIALEASHIQPALSASVSIDHVFSIGAALLGGWIWNSFGFQYVFLFGALIAVVNMLAALRVRIPQQGAGKSTGLPA